VLAVVALAVAAVVGLWWGLARGGAKTSPPVAAPTAPAKAVVARVRTVPVLTEHVTGSLGAPLQDPASAPAGAGSLLLGGLTAADTSSSSILYVTGRGDRPRGTLPSARHDTAAVRIGGAVYLFGGGDGTNQLDEILRIDPATGRVTVAGRLPAASSDSGAAAVGGTAYVVGGYTGTRWLDTIVAWRPGGAAHVVAHLPSPVRYAAVTAVGSTVVIAGGSLPSGTASAAVLGFESASGSVRRLGTLPAPTTHAAAAAIGGLAYVIGGRGATVDTPTARIVSVDPAARRVRPAGTLAVARSDLAAIAIGTRILLAGGRSAAGTVATIGELVRGRSRAAARVGIPPLLSKRNVYAADGANMLSPAVADARPAVYVPNSGSATVDVVDPKTYKVVAHYAVGLLPQHVVPAWDLRTLYVTNDVGNSLTPIDPATMRPEGPPIPVADPYNMYFTPDGRYAIVVAERLHRLDFRDAHTFGLHKALTVPCTGVDHMDFTADGRYALVSCEFSHELLKLDVRNERIVRTIALRRGAVPQDVKLSPDGKVFYVADSSANGLWEIDGGANRLLGFLPTGRGAHGLYPSRDARFLYVTDRGEGAISVISFRTRKQVAKWRIPGGGSPDMGGVSADGKVFWVSGRYNGVLYAISTIDGRLLAKIPVGNGPHGVCVWPQPGRYSLGHTGVLR
jgi:YVTN family beta-propeller protein